MLSISSFGNIMDDLFGGIDGQLRMVSITDSTMMRIVHGAMNNAHERVQSKEGVIERFYEISKFYELAVMQLEGCIKFVEDESSHEEEVLAGLVEIRNRLKGRLGESERAIADKDRELAERAESETRLRRALEAKEREFASLKEKLERTRDINDGDFCELKNSVDQQVWNIRQRLDPDYNGGGSGDDDRGGEIGDEKVEQMGTDIDALKETLDVAFKKMRSAIVSSELAPIEQQWRLSIERDTFCVLFRGLICDLQEIFEFDETRHYGLVDDAEGLKGEINALFARHEEIPQESGSLRSNPSSEEIDDDDDEDENYVTKMIKNHECIIRKKSMEAEELCSMRREVTHEKTLPSSRKKTSQDATLELGSLKEWNDNSIEVPSTISRLEQELQDSKLESRVIEDTYAVLFDVLLENLIELKNQWDENIENNNVESQFREEICHIVFDEAFKTIVETASFALRRCEEAKVAELDEHTKDSLIKEETTDDDRNNRSGSRGIECDTFGNGNVNCSSTPSEEKLGKTTSIGMKQLEKSDSILECIQGFFQVMVDFQQMVEEKLELNSLRLEKIVRHNLNPLVKIVSSLREHESLYRKAFDRRCQNLHKAEIEVDLLGDQVEVLLTILEKIQTSLQNCPPILQQNVWILELLHMVTKELKGVIHTPYEVQM